MAKVALTGGKLIKVGEKIGLYPGCCCESCCCLNFDGINFSFTIDCGNGNETFTGSLFNGNGVDVETNSWSVQVICTTINCAGDECNLAASQACVGYFITVMNNVCGANGFYFCNGNAESFTANQCESSPPANFTTDLFICIGGAKVNKGTITFS